MATKKITISVDEELIEKIDAHSKKIGLSRSGTIISLALDQLEQKNFMEVMPALLQLELSKRGKDTSD